LTLCTVPLVANVISADPETPLFEQFRTRAIANLSAVRAPSRSKSLLSAAAVHPKSIDCPYHPLCVPLQTRRRRLHCSPREPEVLVDASGTVASCSGEITDEESLAAG